jgi:aspartate dehydrogenase
MPDRNPNRELTLAIAGLGAIGTRVATAVDAGSLPGFRLVAASARDHAAATERLAGLRAPPEVVDLAELAGLAEVIVECAPAAVFAEVARPAITRGRILMPLSVGALLSHMDLVDRARETGARIVVPTGAELRCNADHCPRTWQPRRATARIERPDRGRRPVDQHPISIRASGNG